MIRFKNNRKIKYYVATLVTFTMMIVVIGLPLCFFTMGVSKIYKKYNMMTYGTETLGIVTEYIKEERPIKRIRYCIKARFTTYDGELINIVNYDCLSRKKINIGQHVRIYYFENAPYDAIIYEGWKDWLSPIFLILVLGPFFLIGGIISFSIFLNEWRSLVINKS